jgi:hypothetical protein
MAVCLLETAIVGDASKDNDKDKKQNEMKKEAEKLMGRVPELRQKIAGKSIPLEVSNCTPIFSLFEALPNIVLIPN